MPDIAMCRNHTCPSRKDCYRFRARHDKWQVWSDYEVPKGGDRCESFIVIWKDTQLGLLSMQEIEDECDA